MGSGTAAQAALARELGLQQDLTDLRTLQLGKDASAGMDAYDVTSAYRKALDAANFENELKRVQSLYGAAEDEDTNLINQQKWLAQQLSARGDHSVLDKLYGLTQEQIDRLYPKYSPAAPQPAAESGTQGGKGTDGNGKNYKPNKPGYGGAQGPNNQKQFNWR